jgi:DNA-binding NtrC family response regulator
MNEKVLLVDDEQDFVETLAERMRTRNMDVDTSNSAVDALAKLEAGGFDAVVLDLKMPGMDGLEALKAIKARDPNIQVILLTGQATVQKGVEAMKLGAMDLLEKPADLDTLTREIRQAHAQKLVMVSEEAEARVRDILSEKGW